MVWRMPYQLHLNTSFNQNIPKKISRFPNLCHTSFKLLPAPLLLRSLSLPQIRLTQSLWSLSVNNPGQLSWLFAHLERFWEHRVNVRVWQFYKRTDQKICDHSKFISLTKKYNWHLLSLISILRNNTKEFHSCYYWNYFIRFKFIISYKRSEAM